MKIVLASRNPRKIAELRRILAGIQGAATSGGQRLQGVEVVGLEGFPDAPDVPETELTFAGNALLKARAIAAHTGLPTVSDDSGLCVDALNGMPGVLSARWSGRFAADTMDKDRANRELVLDQLGDVAAEHRGAHFICVAALVLPGGEEHTVEGRMEGRIIEEPRGHGGFGYDPIFVADGDTRTNAELAAAEKDAISHRGKALRALAQALPGLLPK